MEVFVHIKNDKKFMDEELYARINMHCRPMRGDIIPIVSDHLEAIASDNIYFDEEKFKEFKKTYKHCFKKGKDDFSFKSYKFVDSVAFIERVIWGDNDELIDVVYDCHIELTNEIK